MAAVKKAAKPVKLKPIKLKKGMQVEAKTISATTFSKGKITEVREGPTGTWYSVKLTDGKVINTRASCIKA